MQLNRSESGVHALPTVSTQEFENARPSVGVAAITGSSRSKPVPLLLQSINEERPPTPPRGRPANQSSSMQFFD